MITSEMVQHFSRLGLSHDRTQWERSTIVKSHPIILSHHLADALKGLAGMAMRTKEEVTAYNNHSDDGA